MSSQSTAGRTVTSGTGDDSDRDGARNRRPLDVAAANGERSLPPRASGVPGVGQLLQLMRDPDGFYRDLGWGYDADVVSYRVNRTEAVMVTHPEYVQQVLVEDAPAYRKGHVISRAFEGFAEKGLVATEGEEWAQDRKLAQPAFYNDRIDGYASVMAEEAQRTVAELAESDVVRVDDAMKSLTLRIIARTMFGTDLSGRGTVIRDAANAILERVKPTTPSSYLPLWVPTPTNYRFTRTMRELRRVMDELVEERRSAEWNAPDGTADLLSMLVDSEYDDGSTMDRERLRDHMVTFVFAGHETTALLLTWALWGLANDEDAQSRLQTELDDVLDGEDPTPDALADATYLDGVVDEATRLYPPAYNMFREAKRDVEIGPFEVPEGTVVTTPQWVVHRDERWFDDPLTFDPGRWTPEIRESLPEYAHYPFGGGPRACIGNRFATLEAKVALATLCSRFDVNAVTDDVGVQFSATLQPDRPVKLAFTER